MEETKSSSDFRNKKNLKSELEEDNEFIKNNQEAEMLKLTSSEWSVIHEKIMSNMPHIEKSLQEIPVNVKGVYLSVFVSLLFIILASYINRVEDVSNMAQVIQSVFENSYWDEASQKRFADIGTLDDVQSYMRRIALPATNTSMGDYNYFIGLRITLKNSELVKNEDPMTKKAVKMKRNEIDIEPDGIDGYKDSGMRAMWEFKTGFADNKGYVIFYSPHLSEDPILITWREAENYWLNIQNFGSMAIEYLFHNPNTMCTLYYYQTFQLNPTGTVYPVAEALGSFIEKFESIKKDSLVIFILFIIYSLGFSLQIFKLAQNMLRTCKTLLVKRKLDLVWHEYIEICSVVLSMVSLILFGTSVFANIGKYQLPIAGEADFTGIANYCRDFRLLVQITALAALLISFKVIVVLRYKFPSFGILFDTILGAKNDIINFILITLFLLIGFVFWGNLMFGYRILNFSTSVWSFKTLFDMALGQLGIKDEMKLINEPLSAIYLLVFLTVFFLVLTNMFLAIVMSTYERLKSQGQLILEAKAEMIAEQSEEWFQALLNLIFFRVVSVENDAIEYEELQDKNRDELTDKQKKDNDEKIKMYETLIIASTKVDVIKIFKTNFGKLSSLNKPTLLTHEQNMQKIQTTLEKILERAELKKKRNAYLQKQVDYNYNLVCQMFIYIVFIVMILLRLRITDSYGIYQLNSESFVTKTFGNDLTLADVSTQALVFSYLNELFVPMISADSLFNQNFFLDQTRARITMQFYNPETNNDKFSENVISRVITKDEEKYVKISQRGLNSKILYQYYPSGSQETFEKKGGFPTYLSIESKMQNVLDVLEFDEVLGYTGSYLAVEWVTYNANLNLFAYSYIKFTHEISGSISQKFYCQPIELDFFKDKIPARGILEIVYFLFTIYYFVIEGKEWLMVWRQVRLEVKEKQKGFEALDRVVIKLIGRNTEEKGCADMIRQSLVRIKAGIRWILTIFFNVLQTMQRYFKRDSFNMIDVSSIILSIMNLSQILQLSTNDFMKDFKIEDSEDYQYISEFSDINQILISYKQIVAFNCLIIFIRLLQFYKFSKRLSLLTDILDSATLDLIFYMLMFSIVLFAYMLMGYLLLGHTLSGFSTLQGSLISCYLMLIGEYTSSDIYDADPIFGTLFLVSLVIVFSLILLNMFIAIIGSHFEIVIEGSDPNEEDMGFFAKIVSVIVAKRKNKKTLDEPERNDDDDKSKNDDDDDDEKPVEDNIYQIEEAMQDPTNPAYWMKVAENILNEKSDKKVSLFGLKMMSSSKEKNQKITAEAKLSEISYLNVELWKQSSISERLKIWRSLAIVSREYAIRSIEKAYIEGGEIPERVRLFKTMEKIWNANTDNEKLELWMGKEHFDHNERVAVWNSLKFMNETFGIPEGESFDDSWESKSTFEKLKLVSQLMDKFQGEINLLKKSSDPIQSLLGTIDKIEDFRFILWLGLTRNSHWLKCLFMNEPIERQSELIAYLNLGLYKDSIFSLEGMDAGLEDLLDGMIYDTVEAKAVYMSELQKLINLKNQLVSSKTDIESLKDYHEYAKLEVQKHKKKKIELENEYKKYKGAKK